MLLAFMYLKNKHLQQLLLSSQLFKFVFRHRLGNVHSLAANIPLFHNVTSLVPEQTKDWLTGGEEKT